MPQPMSATVMPSRTRPPRIRSGSWNRFRSGLSKVQAIHQGQTCSSRDRSFSNSLDMRRTNHGFRFAELTVKTEPDLFFLEDLVVDLIRVRRSRPWLHDHVMHLEQPYLDLFPRLDADD